MARKEARIPGLRWDKETGKGRIDKRVPGVGPVRRRFEASSWDAAEAIYRSTISEAEALRSVKSSRTFRAALTKYLNEETKASLWRDGISAKRLSDELGDLELEEIHQGTVQRYVDKRRADGAKSSTVRRELSVVRRVLKLACRVWRDASHAPWLMTDPLLEMPDWNDQARPYPLTWEEQRRLFLLLPDSLTEMALFAVNTGCRDRIVRELRWEWECRVPELNTTVFLVPGECTKNGTEQLIVLNATARAVIESRRGRNRELVFERRSRMNSKGWQAAWKKAGLPAGSGTMHGPHNLRHTFARRLRQAGVPMATISALMHHIDGSITVHYSPAQVKELIDAVERLRETEGMTLLRVVRK